MSLANQTKENGEDGLIMKRTYSPFISAQSKQVLSELISGAGYSSYRKSMKNAGSLLAIELIKSESFSGIDSCTIASTAEDADFLTSGVDEILEKNLPGRTYSAVFWNNHYQLPTGKSIAPVVHKFIEPGCEVAESLIVTKSVISGACVVRTNILALIESMPHLKKIYVLSPVMLKGADSNLKESFPDNIAEKFEFFFFALDEEKDEKTGEVLPGIGGQVYELLGLESQPVSSSFMPNLVKDKVFATFA